MAIIKCKMCGGDLNLVEGISTAECEYCGTLQTIPKVDDEKKLTLFARANRLRTACEFDKAAGIYESIVADFPEEAEAYWGLVLCNYGIEYVDDPATGKKIPTCHRTCTVSVMDDDNFAQSVENADAVARGVYREEAKAIDRLQRNIIAVAEKEEPYDIFICYKETDDITKSRTEDSSIAQDIYTEFIKEGYKVFFSRVTLRDKAGSEYEPYIYAALSSAKVMLAIGTKFDYYDAVWVKNEWSRYLQMMSKDSSKHLIPCFKDIDAYDMPKEFKNLQGLDMGELTFFRNLINNVERFVSKNNTVSSLHTAGISAQSPETEGLIKRAYIFLEEGDWKNAYEYCERVLDIDPECSRAYLGKFMVDLRAYTVDQINNKVFDISEYKDFDRALRYAVGEEKEFLETIKINAEKKQLIQEQERIARKKQEEEERIAREKREEAERIAREKQKEEERIEHEKEAEEKRKARVKLGRELSSVRNKLQPAYGFISAGNESTVCIRSDGRVAATGAKSVGKYSMLDWRNIIAVSSGDEHTVGVTLYGKAIAAGDNSFGRCEVDSWRDITAVSAGNSHTVGVSTYGNVIATGDNSFGQCNLSKWQRIVAVSAGYHHTVGLNSYGRVFAVGKNDNNECNVSNWRGIEAVSAGCDYTIGLCDDGKVVATGDNTFGQCNVSDWRNMVAISAGKTHTVGLRADGIVVAAGNNSVGQCNVSEWRNIVAISAGSDHTVGLCRDGRVVATGNNTAGKCDVSDFKLFCDIETLLDDLELHKKQEEEERIAREKRAEKRRVAREKMLEKERIAREKRAEEEREMSIRRDCGYCQHCGGFFVGVVNKKCSKCGKPKDY